MEHLRTYEFLYRNLDQDLLLEKKRLHGEFIEWLYENGLLEVTEQNAFRLKEAVESSSYPVWKTEVNNGLHDNFNRFTQYFQQQTKTYGDWLNDNKEYVFNKAKYPWKSSSSKKYPDYKTALQRIRKSIGYTLGGVDLSRIIVDDTTDSNYTDNGWFKHLLIPEYQNDSDMGFDMFAKKYFNGELNKISYNKDQMTEILKMGFRYCTQTDSFTRALNNELSMVVGFINKDPNTGMNLKDLSSEEQRMETATDKTKQGFATSNPNQNINNIQQEATNVPNTQKVDYTNKYPHQTNNKSNTLQQSQKRKDIKKQQIRQKQEAVKIVKTCFNAKISAACSIYYDFLLLIQKHIDSYSKNINSQNSIQKSTK